MPKLIFILRHGEKPAAGDAHLAPKGYQRAGALASLFSAKHNGGAYPAIDALFAAADSDESHRPRLTIAPLATAIAPVKLEASYKDKQFAELAGKLLGEKYDGKILLVCWHHGEIPALATALKAKEVPEKWPEDRFDLVWQLAYDTRGAAKLTILPQLLLYGDKPV